MDSAPEVYSNGKFSHSWNLRFLFYDDNKFENLYGFDRQNLPRCNFTPLIQYSRSNPL